ncbi:hypothetical protein CJF30_00006172 [Rutstroemia sp. NJR-2017a BBW]|nr:hypothetical protein CJF30_00006172 [Rutstroemia sp. NJR-2017a BBW]
MDTPESVAAPPPNPAQPVAVFKKRSAKGKSNFRKRAATPPPANDDSDDTSGYSSSEDESGRRVKRRKKNTGAITASSKTTNPSSNLEDLSATKYTAAHSTTIRSSNDATKQTNWYDENANDALSSKNLLGTTRSKPPTNEDNLPDGTYKGLANSTKFIQKNPDAPNRVVGPVKAPTNIRTITVTDFAPDLDREWENVTKGKKVVGGTKIASANRNAGDAENDDEDEDALLENIPFACIICREKYKDPIVTKCGHYFCESCALKRYRKDPSCAACGAGTGGVFNVAKGLKKLLDRKRERARKLREEAIANGEEVDEDEEEEE